jgi:hypothetical protein
MKPVTVTIADETVYAAYLDARTNGLLAALGEVFKTLADNIPSSTDDGHELRPFADHVQALAEQLVASGILSYMPDDEYHQGHVAWLMATLEESGAA